MAAGQKTGGRKAGTPNKASAAKAAAIAASGLTPLDFMLSVMRDENAAPEVRLEAARSAAPYVHPRLSAVAYSGPEGGPIEMRIEDKRAAALAILDATFGEVAPTGTGE